MMCSKVMLHGYRPRGLATPSVPGTRAERAFELGKPRIQLLLPHPRGQHEADQDCPHEQICDHQHRAGAGGFTALDRDELGRAVFGGLRGAFCHLGFRVLGFGVQVSSAPRSIATSSTRSRRALAKASRARVISSTIANSVIVKKPRNSAIFMSGCCKPPPPRPITVG